MVMESDYSSLPAGKCNQVAISVKDAPPPSSADNPRVVAGGCREVDNDAGSWIQDPALMLSMCEEVPWYLDDGSARVFCLMYMCDLSDSIKMMENALERGPTSAVNEKFVVNL